MLTRVVPPQRIRAFLNINVCPFSIQPVLSYRQHRWPFSWRGSRTRCGSLLLRTVGTRPNFPAAGYISDSGNASFWNVDYYQHYFDVDTKTVSFSSPPPFPDSG